MKYEMRFLEDQPDDWEEISREEFLNRLGKYYRKPAQLISDMLKSGMPVRTPFAMYRVVVEQPA